jgi:enoyl-CoA hydratase/carnithine racemase
MYTTLSFEEAGDIARVTLKNDRITMAMVRELTEVCNHLDDESTCKVVVFQGSEGQFSRGIDFAEFRPDEPMDIHGFNKWEKICVRIERLAKATIALVDGECTGGGAQLALVTDAVLATPKATFQFNEVHLGFLPGMATFRLAKNVGLGRAKRLIMQCPVLTAEEAEQLGIVTRVADNLESALESTVAAFGPNHTVAVTLARRLLNESFSTDFENGIGNFLAAQHRAIHQTPFLDTIKKHRDE